MTRARLVAAGSLLLSLALVASACVTVTSETPRSERRALSAVTPPEAFAQATEASPAVDLVPSDETTEDDATEASDAAPVVGYISLDESDAGVDGVISVQPFPDLTEEVCQTLAGVPTIGIVYDQGPCQVSLFEIDQAESGRLAGSALGAFAAERFDCDVKAFVSLGSSAEDEIGGARLDGYEAGYAEHCAMPKRTRRVADAQHLVTAQNKFLKVLDDIKGKPILVAGVSEDAILGAMGAADRRDRRKQVWYSGQLAGPAIRKTIACDEHYVASVAQFPERFGSTVVPALVDAINGASVPPVLQAELELITAENVRELFPDTPECGT